MIQVARRGVVNRVGLFPIRVRHQGEHADEKAKCVVRAVRLEKRSVAAVVLQNEEANQEH